MASRVAGLVLAGLCALALATGALSEPPLAAWLEAWEQQHPDPRDDAGAAGERFRDERRERLAGTQELLAWGGLLAGLVLALPRRRDGDGRERLLAALLAGALPALALTGARGLAAATDDQRATLGDDALAGFVGPLAEELRNWRERVPADQALLLVGTNDYLLSRVAWVLHPRPVHPLVLPAPPGWTLEQLAEAAAALDTGREAPGRWLVDLAALAARRPALAPIPDGPEGGEAPR